MTTLVGQRASMLGCVDRSSVQGRWRESGRPSPAPDDGGAETSSHASDLSLTPVVAVLASSVAESPRAGNTTTAAGHWSEIQAMFADDPGASIELAAGLVHDRLGALVTSVKDRQQSRRSAWRGYDSGTEDLHVTLRHYRVFWHRLEDFHECTCPAGWHVAERRQPGSRV